MFFLSNKKNHSRFFFIKAFSACLLLFYFVFVKNFFVEHQFSHQEKILEKNLSFVKENKNEENKNLDSDCLICSNISLQNQIVSSTNFCLVISSFILIFLARNFNRIKLSYLSSFYYSQAPPKI
jgi:hypothetical protein